ncbi:MAG TPA: energy transducer TonB [Anaeromyxobacter sp.]|nr:energy transducer TonB [Anaeromyxobacter sp.]
MAIPVATALGRREPMWPAVIASIIVHVLVVAWAVARRPPPPIDLAQKPIVAKLVRLGEKRPEEWLPRKDAAPPPPALPAAAPAPVAAPTAAKPAAPAAKAPPRPPAPSAAGKAGGTSLSSILSKVQRQVEETRWGDPSGSPSGDSDTSEGNPYYAVVERALHSNYTAPATIPDRERLYLEANVILWIEPDGRIARWRQERSSGNPVFDAAVDRALRATTRVPPPPDDLRESLRRTGIQLVFRARDT